MRMWSNQAESEGGDTQCYELSTAWRDKVAQLTETTQYNEEVSVYCTHLDAD